MNYLKMEEKNFKRCLKNKVTFEVKTLIKYLMVGVTALSLTACGGGGGGGGSSSSGGDTIVPPDISQEIPINNSNLEKAEEFIGKNVIINGEIKGNKDFNNKSAIVARNSVLVLGEDTKITLEGDNAIALEGTTVLRSGVNFSVTNKGNITLNGKNQTGIYVNNGVKGINEGNITVTKNEEEEKDEDFPEYLENFAFGMKGIGSEIENKGTINITGSAIGMYVENGTAENEGTINITGIKEDSSKNIKTPIGMVASGNNSVASNKKDIVGNGTGIQGMFAYANGKAINEGKINITGNEISGMNGYNGNVINNGDIALNGDSANGMDISGGSAVNNKNIIINSSINYGTYKGMVSSDNGSLTNNGIISIKSENDSDNPNHFYGMSTENSKATNTGEINIKGNYVIGIEGINGSTLLNTGDIILTSLHKDNNDKFSAGMKLNDSNATNTGKIKIEGDYIAGITGDRSNITNEGDIEIISENSFLQSREEILGIKGSLGIDGEDSNITNKGNITGTGNNITGIYDYNGEITNESTGNINLTGEMNTGIYITGDSNGTATNNGIITITGKDSDGILAELKGIATNNGEITVVGENSFGMSASSGGAVTNEKDGIITVSGKDSYGMMANGEGSKAINKGIINVGAEASGGMLADNNGFIYNEGTINIDKSHTDVTEEDKENFALQTKNGGTVENKGTININADVVIENNSSYIVGTDKDGSYGKLSGENVNLDGNLVINTNMVKGSYENSYVLEDVIKSDNINLGENYKDLSDSLLYDAKTSVDKNGNLDGKLIRNDKNISDFTTKKFSQLSSVFDKYINDKSNYDKLTDEEKELVDTIFGSSSSQEKLQETIQEIAGTEYLSLSRQIFDIKDTFKKYDSSVISTLNDYDFNFEFIGEYSDVDSKNGIDGYDSKMTGFNGAMKFTDTLYGVLGYGYSDIDYDGSSDGNIQTIHTGLYKDIKYNEFNVRLGVFGEYNFHEVDRSVLDKTAKSDFDSYLIGTSAEVSRRFGESLYIKPMVSLDVTYGNIDGFEEDEADNYNLKVDEEDYTSIISSIGFKAGKEFLNSEVFISAKYSYEFGDMNKDMTIELLREKAEIENNYMENGQFDISLGATTTINSFTLSIEAGKEYQDIDREYVKAGFSYSF